MTIENFPQLLETFLENQGDNTQRTYRAALSKFLEYLDGRAITEAVLLDYPGWLSRQVYEARPTEPPQPYSKSTINLYLVAVNQLMDYLIARRRLEFDYVTLVQIQKAFARHKAPDRTPRGKRTPDGEIIEALLEAVQADVSSNTPAHLLPRAKLTRLRNIAIVYTFLASGVRVSELVSLDVDDLLLQDGVWSAWVKGKGGRVRKISLGRKAGGVIQDYLQARADTGGRGVPLFCRHDRGVKDGQRRRLGVRAVQNLITALRHEVAARLGRPVDFSPHSLRHFFARSYLDQGGDLTYLRRGLGHAQLSTTGIYADANEADVVEDIARKNFLET